MHEKKKRIIEVGLKLFAKKGFHATSIQEIAEQSEVSKGAFYLHFKSKGDLILSIYEYFYEKISSNIEKVDLEEGLLPRERVEKQLQDYCKEFQQHKDFFVMLMRENISLNDDIDSIASTIRSGQLTWLQRSIHSLYGEQVQPFVNDAVLIFYGMIHAYLQKLIFEQITYNLGEFSSFLLRRLDDLVEGLMNDHSAPLLTIKETDNSIELSLFPHSKREEAKAVLRRIENKLNEIELIESKKDEVLQSINVMQDELEKEEPQKVVFQGMLVHLKSVNQLESYRNEISNLFHLQLL
ncbi:TetR/AcrR family transcriptional regulator [Bacillus solimangrovi]|uniref:HTH tetR-type domain-containing protein n=1 Tax=Bacillus solimangrovi TaxID=1305675 RepID=A0A1E5LDM4_9BACI|nr:TetR/AcrR family transcriptional regulator [Bacillus solimangrovi]OEH92172.1 hypothetical protein BFG57_02565 [Bacillus solimangrovi]